MGEEADVRCSVCERTVERALACVDEVFLEVRGHARKKKPVAVTSVHSSPRAHLGITGEEERVLSAIQC